MLRFGNEARKLASKVISSMNSSFNRFLVGVLSATTKKFVVKKIAKIEQEKIGSLDSNKENAPVPSSLPCSAEAEPKTPPRNAADGKFYAMRFENNENLIFDNIKDFNEHKKKMKSSQPRFAIFDEKRKAELWLAGVLKTPVRPKRPELSVFRSQGPNESPLRRPKEISARNFVGELKSPFKAPDQPLLNKIVSEIRTKRDSSYSFVMEELMKNPRLLISKADTPVPYHAGSWANLGDLFSFSQFLFLFSAHLLSVRRSKYSKSDIFPSRRS